MHSTYEEDSLTTGLNWKFPIWAEKIEIMSNTVHKNDVVFVVLENGNRAAKRVIATPNDTIKSENGEVYVNSGLLIEDYLSLNCITSDFEEILLSENECFIMGDNREYSEDSRVYGPINLNNIKAINSKYYFTIG